MPWPGWNFSGLRVPMHNNPTGACLTADELESICNIAGRAGAWVVSDEIYRGAEIDNTETPTISIAW